MSLRRREDIEALESQTLAPYAAKSKEPAWREFKEPPHEIRTCYQRDRDRIVHSEAFRKLEYKTQVFTIFEGDYYRTRLTHTLEVAQMGRTIGRSLRLNEDLIEAIALAHDLGHPPFGHAGEDALNALMKEGGGFNHNKRSFEIVTKYEKRYPQFDGLNLTREVLIGILKHRSIYDIPDYNHRGFTEGPTLEAQIVDFSDSLAYLNHDIDDGLTSGCISEKDLMESALWQKALDRVDSTVAADDREMRKYQVVKNLIDMQVKDLLATTAKRLEEMKFKSSQEVKDCKKTAVSFSDKMTQERDVLQELLNQKLYRHFRVLRMTSKARRIIKDLFEVYLEEPRQLPPGIYSREKKSKKEQFKIIGDYIASMTDRGALDEHKKLFNPYSKV